MTDWPEIILKCHCSEMDHQMKFSYNDDDDGEWEHLYVRSGMDIEIPFWFRLKNAIKYLFKRDQAGWVFGETVLLPSDGRDLEQFLQKYREYTEKNGIFR